MTSAVLERKTLTEREEIENLLPLFEEQQMKDLLKYARFLQWSYEEDDEDDSWADMPLTPEEEEAFRQGREDKKNGKLLSLEEFLEGL